MANKFTQSVLERQHQEAMEAKRKKKPPQEAAPVEENNNTPSIVPTPAVVKSPNLEDYLIKQTERVAKNKTFYLDQSVIDAVKAAAKAQHVTDSKLVNDILLTVLGKKKNH